MQALPSSQETDAPLVQEPPLQTSPLVQALPSSHAFVFGLGMQPTLGLQVSVVHALPSSQLMLVPVHVAPPEQWSLLVHRLPSLQEVDVGSKTSVGHVVAVPSHTSCMSQTPADGLQTVPEAFTWFVQEPAPSHISGSSQPEELLLPQEVEVSAYAFTGQEAVEPVQLSATSHSPFCGRHTVADERKTSLGQVSVEPVQYSATSQSPAEPRHSTELGSFASLGQSAAEPVQASA